MLKQRLITAAVLIPIVVGGVLWLSYAQFAVFFAVFAVIGGWEWSRFLRMHNPLLRVSYATIVAAVILSSEIQNACWRY